MNNLEANTSSRSSQVCDAWKNLFTNKNDTLVHGNKAKLENFSVILLRNKAKLENYESQFAPQ